MAEQLGSHSGREASRSAGGGKCDSGIRGVAVLAVVALGNVVLWLVARPGGQPTRRYLGELCGSEVVVLLACALVLATILPFIEAAFGGLDRVAVWHRRAATIGVLLLIPHVLLVTTPTDPYSTALGHALGDIALAGLLLLTLWALAPRLRAAKWPGPIRRLARATYERWLSAHRLTGLFVGIAVAHGAIVGPTFHRSTVLRVSFLSIGGLGIAAYVYRELFARFVVPVYEYEVAEVRHVNDSTLVVGLDPVRSSLAFVAGQFVFVEIGGSAGWQRHPFTVSSAPAARRLELSIKATGDYTRDLQDSLRPGLPAKVTGPFGGFDYRSGTDEQIWIAGGIGITPFISWIRALDGTFAKDVDFYYSVKQRDDAVYANEVIAAAARHPSLRVHLVITDTDGVLTADAVMSARSGRDSSVYMCGPTAMTDSLSKGFRRLGVRPNRIRWEQFAGR